MKKFKMEFNNINSKCKSLYLSVDRPACPVCPVCPVCRQAGDRQAAGRKVYIFNHFNLNKEHKMFLSQTLS